MEVIPLFSPSARQLRRLAEHGLFECRARMRVKISDLCLVVAAIALGVRLSMLATEPFYWPFDNHLSRGMFLGAVVLCPMVFLKQFLFERRKTQLRFGEWLWVIFCLWFSLVLLLT
jgi:hypothetical protein